MELGIQPAAAKALIKDQAITSLDTLKEMSEEEITILCKVIRRSGGSVEQPMAGVGRTLFGMLITEKEKIVIISQSVEATYIRRTGAENKNNMISQRNVHSRSNHHGKLLK